MGLPLLRTEAQPLAMVCSDCKNVSFLMCDDYHPPGAAGAPPLRAGRACLFASVLHTLASPGGADAVRHQYAGAVDRLGGESSYSFSHFSTNSSAAAPATPLRRNSSARAGQGASARDAHRIKNEAFPHAPRAATGGDHGVAAARRRQQQQVRRRPKQ